VNRIKKPNPFLVDWFRWVAMDVTGCDCLDCCDRVITTTNRLEDLRPASLKVGKGDSRRKRRKQTKGVNHE